MHILVADKRLAVRKRFTKILHAAGYPASAIGSPEDVPVFIKKSPHTVDIALIPPDERKTLARTRRLHPHIAILLIATRQNSSLAATTVMRQDADDYLALPATRCEILARVGVVARSLNKRHTEEKKHAHAGAHAQRLSDELRRTQNEIVARIFSAMESCGEETDAHVRRVGWISACIASLLGWPQHDVDALKIAAALHDLGKISVPDVILRKRGALNPAEYVQVMEHSAMGARILSGSSDPVIRMAESIAMHHHERWDGSGYPAGLSGKTIPIEARIAAIADVYDALTSERVYRMGIPDLEAARMIYENAGAMFDPELCAIFMDNLDRIRQYCAEEEAFLSRAPISV